MRIKKIDERVKLLRDMVNYSKAPIDPVVLYKLLTDDVTSADLPTITALCQAEIRLPIYTVNHAAAWLGLSRRGVVEAYRSKRLPYIQPGREVLFLHDDLVKFAQERRYEL